MYIYIKNDSFNQVIHINKNILKRLKFIRFNFQSM